MEAPICDLVLLSWNHLDETQACLESLLDCTRVPCRLFIVDNGSEADVRAFLAMVKPRGAIKEVALLQNETNEGFPRGMNRGIQVSTAPYVCLLNNDLRFTIGWLQEMIDLTKANTSIGVINPKSSTFGDYPARGQSLQDYADTLRRAFHGQYVEVGMCIGFCLLIKREVLDRVGGLSEEVERIFFEDEDFSMRAQRAGYQCVVAWSSYVYHAEHRTIRKMPEREALFQRNQQWCHRKWGRRVRMAWPRFEPIKPGSEELRQWLTQLIGWARRRSHVYVYCPGPERLSRDEWFRSVGLIPHADVHWYPLPSYLAAPVAATGMILKRIKKPFDLIVAPEPHWGRSMQRWQWWHRADIVPQGDDDQLMTAWQKKSRSPL